VEALRAVLDIVSRGAKGYTYDRMMRYLNTGLAGITKAQAGAVDTYLTATNTVGRSLWENGFQRFPKSYWLHGGTDADRQRQKKRREDYLARINRLRAAVMETLIPLQRAFDAQTTVRQKVIALYEYMTAHHYEERLRRHAEELREDGAFVMAQTWESIYASIIEILDKLVAILGDEVMANAELSAVLDAGLADLAVGTIPPTLDQVLVGDFMRTRLSDIKVLYVMGLNDTNVPSRQTSPNLLSDRDRLELSSCHGVALAPDCNTAAYQEQFYLYQMLTKPTEQLVLSYARMDVLGTAMRPSSLLSKVQKILPNLVAKPKEQEVYLTTRATVYPYLVHAAADWLADAEQSEAGEVEPVIALCVADAQYQKEWQRFQAGWLSQTQENALPPELSLSLYGARLKMSVTRLEQYAGCAFAHFLKYGLHIKETEKYQFESADFGTVLHKVVELFGRQIKDEGLSYHELTEQAIVERTKQCVAQALEESHFEFAEEGERSRYSMKTIERIAKRTMKILCRQAARGNFVPSEFELTFGADNDIKGPTYPVGEGAIQLQGTIDRLDVYEDADGRMYLKVVDYKTGKKQLDLTKVYYGLQVQLLTYLMVAQKYYKEDAESIPAAALYYSIQDPVHEHTGTLYGVPEEQRAELIDKVAQDTVRQYAMNGIVNDAAEVLDNIEVHDAGAYQFESIPVAFNKDGTMAKRSKCNSAAEIDTLLGYVEREIVALGGQMLSGNVEIAPYKYKQESACSYCPYQSVCLIEQNRGACERVLSPKEIGDFTGGEEHDTK
jgi:ATP-dependent helicase/nuclease subunit B